jgi:cell division septal protein FtsQ
VNLAAVLTFLVRGVRPRSWWESQRAERATRIATTLWIVLLLFLIGVVLAATRRST